MRWSLLFGIAIFAALFLYIDPSAVLTALKSADLGFFILALGINFIELVFQTLRFRAFSMSFDKKESGFLTYAKIQAVANATTYIAPAKTGHAIKTVLQKKLIDLDYAKGLSIFFIERFQEFMGVYILLLILAFGISTRLGFLEKYFLPISILLAIIVVGTIAMITVNISPLLSKLIPKKYIGKFDFAALQKSIKSTFGYWLFGKTMLFSLTTPVLSIIRLFVVFLAFGMEPDILVLSAIFLVSLIVGVVTFLPGGLGAFETSALALYAASFDYPVALIGAALLSLRIFSIIFDTTLGLLAARSLEKKVEMAQVIRQTKAAI